MGIFLFWRNGYGRNGIAFWRFGFDPHPGHHLKRGQRWNPDGFLTTRCSPNGQRAAYVMPNPTTSKVRRRKSAHIRLKQGSCSAKIYVSHRTRKGRTYLEYTLAYSFAKKRIRRSFATETAARLAGQEVLTRMENGHIHTLHLSKADADSLAWATEQLRPIGMSLFEAVSEFLAARRLASARSNLKQSRLKFAFRH